MTSTTDLPLSSGGQLEARRLAKLLGSHAVEDLKILVSPMNRTIETARLSLPPECTWHTDKDLVECHFGECEGEVRKQLELEWPAWDFWLDGCPGGESLTSFLDRCRRTLQKLESDHANTLLVTHGVFIKGMLSIALSRPLEQFAELDIPTASMTTIRLEPSPHGWGLVSQGVI